MTLPGSSGLLNYRARTYDPRIGRFLQMDPIGYQGGMNLFAYVGGDPMNFTDPWGLDRSGTGAPPRPLPGCTITHLDVSEDQIEWEETCSAPIIGSDWTMVDARFNFGLPSGGGGRYAIAASGGQDVPSLRNGPKPPSHDDNDPDYNRDLNRCRALADSGNRDAASRCFDSAERRKFARDRGTPEDSLPPLVTWRQVTPRSNIDWHLDAGGALVAAGVVCVVLEPCGAAVATGLGLTGLGVAATQ